jgi:hypothetical protein
VATSHRYELIKKGIIEKLNMLKIESPMQKLNCLAKLMMRDSLLNFHSVFLDTLYITTSSEN